MYILRFILFTKPDLFSGPFYLIILFKQSLAVGVDFQKVNPKSENVYFYLYFEVIYQVHFSMQHLVNVCLNLNTSYKNCGHVFSQWGLFPRYYTESQLSYIPQTLEQYVKIGTE